VRIRVTFDLDVPGGVSDERLHEWLRFELHDNGVLEAGNPLEDRDIEPVWGSLEWHRLGPAATNPEYASRVDSVGSHDPK
jgi:hypothetical protein